MKTFNYVLLSLFAFLAPLTACTDGEESALKETLEIGKSIVDFDSEAGSQQIMVATNVDLWTAKSDKPWCHPTPNGTFLQIAVDKSSERTIREAVITITAGAQLQRIRVRQIGYDPAILIDKEKLEVQAAGGWLNFSITTNVEVELSLPAWIVKKEKHIRSAELVTKDYTYWVLSTTLDEKRSGEIVFTEILAEGTSKDVEPLSVKLEVIQSGLNDYNAGTGEDINDDVKLKIISGEASSFQPGEGIEKSFDDDYSTIYHSNWNNGGANYFPITLTYQLEEVSDVDYLVYHPRQDSYNGHFKEVEIEYSADGTSFQKLMDKDFKGSSMSTKIIFDSPLRAKAFRFIVKSGGGDGNGFASCSEMEFYTKDPSAFDYSTLFTDETCSELKNGITEADIDQCEYPFFKNIAYYLFKGKYETEFRIAEFKSYPHPDIQSRSNKTNPYSLLDNPTGISVKENESLIVMVGDTYGHDVALRVQNLDKPDGDGFGGVSYPLSRGLNKFTMKTKGLVYVMYHTSELDDPRALPIKMHFASGTVNGYFDSQRHAGRWKELIGKATDRYFDVVGQYAHLTFETEDLRQYAGDDGERLIQSYDDIVRNEAELLGLYRYDRMFRNRLYLNVMYHSYMYATSYHTGYERGTMSEICNVDKLRSTACWGPAHEIGHCNQTRPGILWKGTTEVTNNIMSLYIQTSIFKQNSRVQEEDMGENYRNRYSKAWTQIIAQNAPHADFGNGPVGEKESDVFCKLIPFWQLELYFGRVLGRTPLLQEDKGGFYPDIYEYARTHVYDGADNGKIQLDFVYNACLAARMNLLSFFQKWGFLTPIDKVVDDYGKGTLKITATQIEDLKKKVNALGFSAPDVALEYISDNTYELYKHRPSVKPGSSAIRTGSKLVIRDWENVVAYEVKDAAGKLVFISSGERTPSSEDYFTITGEWKPDYKVYAVSVSGTRTEVPVQ